MNDEELKPDYTDVEVKALLEAAIRVARFGFNTTEAAGRFHDPRQGLIEAIERFGYRIVTENE